MIRGIEATNQGGEGVSPMFPLYFKSWNLFSERSKVPSPAPEYGFEPNRVRADGEIASAPPGGAPTAVGDWTPERSQNR
jgi:hypothetical protein